MFPQLNVGALPPGADEEKLVKAREFKAKGNVAFRDGDFRKAKGCYHRALLFIKGLSMNTTTPLGDVLPDQMTEEQKAEALSLTCDCHNNLAASLLNDKDPRYERAIECCDEVLQVSPTNAKALYRKGTCLFNLKKYEEALETFQQAETKDGNFKRHIQMCKEKMGEQKTELAKMYQNMFK